MVSKEVKEARRAKLTNILKTKMLQKHGTKDAGPVGSLNKQIEEIVDDVLSLISGVAVDKEALARIDGRCKNANDGYMRAQGKDPLYVKIAPKKPKPKDGKPKLIAPVSLKNDWVIMDGYEAIENDKSIKADKIKLHNIKMSVRATLDIQMAEKEEARKKEKAIEDGFLREQQSIMEQWNYEQSIAHTMGHSKNRKEKKIRDEQCRLNAIKRQKIKDKEEKEARHEVAVCKRELKREEEEKIKRINDQKAQNVENGRAVASQFGKREKEEREQKAEDHRLMLQMKEMMLQQELDRKKAFNKRVEKYEEFSSKWQESGAGKEQREAELHWERKILREAQAKDAAVIKREEDDIKKVKTMALFLQTENLKMADAKKRKEEKFEAEDAIRNNTIRKAGEAYQAGGWERAQEERKKGMNYARELMKQRMEVNRRETKIEMGNVERIMNRKFLNKLQNDPQIIEDIQNKMFEKKKMKKSDMFKYSSNLPGFSKPGADNI
ncbi:hypothetical protein TrLO_g10239 [Triparma laevis f. longispina]|uniref:Trichohyalin-plectin-homology domain-containing protein n=1 Tax=Triparma laevis f. longispina TaxID=1714387 RepID=A0A9W6ZKX5_9STRA|nr:hypothetical protein TrLO_g10239 [Triparma laevis f. longispina]